MPEPGQQRQPAGTAGAARRPSGTLEAQVLGILRAADSPLSPGKVRDQITAGHEPELSYSTVVTIISRLYDKGLLARQRSGRGFAYTALDEASIAAGRMRLELGSQADHDTVLSRFVSGLSGRDAGLLRTLLAEMRDSAADGTDEPPDRG
jgi:predicted transcriptional regulator